MKLVRLATDNNGVFASAFQNDMVIAKDSQMALLNLTFQTNIGVFAVVPPQATIKFTSDNSNLDSQQEITLLNRSYALADADTFYQNIQHSLNETLKSENSIGTTDKGYNAITSDFRISTSDQGLKTIEWRIAPFINPVENFGTIAYQQMNWSTDYITASITGFYPDKETEITKANGKPASADRVYKVLPHNGRRLNDGCSMFMARCANVADNGSGAQDNGFGIGLSKTNLATLGLGAADDIPTDVRDFEIRVNRMGETYKYINDNSTEKDSGLQPRRIDISGGGGGGGGILRNHDVLMFKVSGNLLYIGVAQDAGANGLFTQFGDPIEIQAGEELYPYLYIRGADTHCKVDMFNFSIDPWLPSIGGNENGNDDWTITGNLDTGRGNGYADVLENSLVGDVLPQVPNSKGRLNNPTTARTKGSLIMNNAVWRALGFTQFKSNGGFINFTTNNTLPQPGWVILTAISLPAKYTSDNFIVESMSLPLDSFDASKTQYPTESTIYINPETNKRGRRKNILMTIPENNNGVDGLIEYEASTPIFVDINNAEEINAKNLNFRVLNKDFSPLVQGDETAIMTILIKKPNE